MARTPQVKWSLSNENILTMEIDGISIEEAAQSSGHTNWQNYYEDVAELLFVSQGMTQGKLEIGKMIFGMMQVSQKHGIPHVGTVTAAR